MDIFLRKVLEGLSRLYHNQTYIRSQLHNSPLRCKAKGPKYNMKLGWMQNQLRVNVYLPIRLFQGRRHKGCPLKKDQVCSFKFSFVKAEFTVGHLTPLCLKYLTPKFFIKFSTLFHLLTTLKRILAPAGPTVPKENGQWFWFLLSSPMETGCVGQLLKDPIFPRI